LFHTAIGGAQRCPSTPQYRGQATETRRAAGVAVAHPDTFSNDVMKERPVRLTRTHNPTPNTTHSWVIATFSNDVMKERLAATPVPHTKTMEAPMALL